MYLDISYLKPKSQTFLNKHSKYYIKSGMDGAIVRNVYEKVEYDEYEKNLIERLKEAIQETLPNNWKTSDYLKMLVSADFQLIGAIKNLKIHLDWLNYYNTHHPDLSQLERGDFYIFGIDKQSRPVIIVKYVDESNFQTFQYMLETIKRQVLVPYYVENWTVIFDQQNKDYNYYEAQDLISFIPTKAQIHQKIKIISKIEELQQYIPAEQLEEKYGGECYNITKYWPPQMPKTNEFLKQLTLDCIEEFSSGQRRLQEFKNRDIRKFSTLGRLQHNSTMTYIKDPSISQGIGNRSSSSQQFSGSHLKIVVREENGNQLIQEDIEIPEDEDYKYKEEEDQKMCEQTKIMVDSGTQQQQQQQLQKQKEDILIEADEEFGKAAEDSCCSPNSCKLF